MFGAVPGLQVIASYRRRWLVKDVIAGVVLTTLLVPQGMAYAELAGLPPITGLYTSIMCLLGYAVFGPSRILVLGPDSSLGPMIAATILPLMAANGDAKRAVALASILAIMVAAIMIVAAVAKLGFIADLISKPTMIGYMNGLALTILIGQLPKLFGFKVSADGLIGEAAGFINGLANGDAVAAAAVVGIAGIALILVLQRWLLKVPRGSSWWCSRSPPRRSFTWPVTVSAWSGCCPRGSRRSPSRTCTCPISGPCSPGAWASRWSLSPTRSPPRRRSPPVPGRRFAGMVR
jgi:MFS superfamily sulfate permease-like transporter